MLNSIQKPYATDAEIYDTAFKALRPFMSHQDAHFLAAGAVQAAKASRGLTEYEITAAHYSGSVRVVKNS
jgi:hypothetical protein